MVEKNSDRFDKESDAHALPSWFKPDNSSGESGKLLYLEEWGKKRKFEDWTTIIMGPIFIIIGIAMAALPIISLYFGWLSGSVDDIIMGVLFMEGIGFAILFLFFNDVKTKVCFMPFAVYENGFTLTAVSWRQGWRRQETFIPWTHLESVALEELPMYNFVFRIMKLKYDVGKELKLENVGRDRKNLTDPFEVMKLFKRFVPGKINKAFDVFLGDENERQIINNPLPSEKPDSEWLIGLGFLVFISFGIGTLLAQVVSGEKSPAFLIIIFSIFLPITVVLFYLFAVFSDRGTQRNLIEEKAAFTTTGITIPKTFYGRHIKNIRSIIPWSEIRAIRMKLSSTIYYHEAEFETVSGEKYRIPYKIYERMEEIPDFRKIEWDYFNTTPATSSLSLETWNHSGLAVFAIVLSIPALVVAFTGAGGEFWEQWDKVWSKICIGLIFGVLLPFYIFLRWGMAQRLRLGEGLKASEKGISIPNAPAKLRNISPESFISARIDKDLYGPYCELNTTVGSIKLPQASAEMLIHAGYPVENAGDLGALPFEGYLGEKPAVSTREPSDERELPETIELGELILQGSQEFQVKQKKKLLKFGLLVVGVGALSFILIVPPFSTFSMQVCGQTCFVMFGIVFVALGLLGVKLSVLMEPVRIYENGIVFPDVSLKAGEIFVPYGRITNVAEAKKPVWGEVIHFHAGETMKYMVVKSMPGFLEILDDIKEKIGKPEYDCKSFEYPYQEAMPLVEKMFTAVAFGIGFSLAALYIEFMEGIDYEVHWGKLLFYGGPLTLAFLVSFAYLLEFGKEFSKKIGQNLHINTRFFGSAMIVAVLLFAVGVVVDEPSTLSQEIFHDSPPTEFAWDGGLIENESFELKQSIYVQEDSSLLIRNSTITFTMTEDKGCSIYVAEGGRLEIMNSSIGSAGSEYGYGFEIYGEALFADSRFSGIYGPDDIINGDGGMEIYSDDVILFNCTITDNPVNGILISRASPTIENCVIKGNKDDGIEIHHSNAKIANCTFLGNGWGMVVFSDSRCQVLNNSFKDNEHGVHVEFSSPEIKDNIFENNTEYAVGTVSGTDVDHLENTFINNGAKFHVEKTLDYYFSMCGIILLIVGFVAGGIVIFKAQNRKIKL